MWLCHSFTNMITDFDGIIIFTIRPFQYKVHLLCFSVMKYSTASKCQSKFGKKDLRLKPDKMKNENDK